MEEAVKSRHCQWVEEGGYLISGSGLLALGTADDWWVVAVLTK